MLGEYLLEWLERRASQLRRERELAPSWQDRWGLGFTDRAGDTLLRWP